MVQHIQIYLFGDQTYDSNSRLGSLLRSHKNPILTAFLERAFHVLRAEIGRLSLREREAFPRFSSIADLLTRQREGNLSPALEKALTCIYQLAYFISQHGDKAYPVASETYMIGLCTGTLAAAAISSCRTLSELLLAAVQTVVVAFRAGLCTVDLRNRIEPSITEARSWSMVVPGIKSDQASQAIKDFCESQSIPFTSQPYISAHGTESLTISGPPGTLQELRNTPTFSKLNAIKIPIYAPYHAAHLFSKTDIESILETTTAESWSSFTANIPVISSATGKQIWAGNFRSLLQEALAEILIEPMRWDKINQEFAAVLRSSGASQFKVIPIATTAEQSLYSTLKQVAQSSPEPSPTEAPSVVPEFPTGRPDQSKIAIIGMSGRFPDASSPAAYWDLLYQGLDVHKEVPLKHWDIKTHVDPTGKKKNTSAMPYGCWLENPGFFDARFFNMSPREAPQVDPAQRIALLTAYEAIEQAGLVPDATPSTQKDRVGIFYGVTSNDWMETNSAQDIDTYFIPGGNRAFIPGRINYCFKFSGPSYSVDTACSSSLAAIHVACNSLWRGDVDTAIAGGTNVLTNPDMTAGLDKGHFLSRTGNCKTFDDGADGYCRGEGVGTVIMKRLEDALLDNDPIQAVILGAATNHSAEAESITRPHVGAQRAIFEKILSTAGLDPYNISYVEMHGTGTQAGDAGEMSSVLETFAPGAARQKRRSDQPLYLGSAKANIGHGEAVSGVSSLAKVLLMMQKNIIPPHCGIKTKINHKFPTDFDERNVHIASAPTPWPRAEGEVRHVFLNNFSAAGGNTALLLEDAPEQIPSTEHDPRSTHLVTISAKCAASLKGNLKAMLEYLGSVHENHFSLSRLSYTTTARRIHHAHRVIVHGADILEVKSNLEGAIAREEGMNRAKSAPKVAFTFTGQGAQYPGMGKQLFEAFSQFRSDIRRFDQLGQSQGFPSIQPIFTATGGDIGDYTPLVVQLANVCMQMALTRLWASWGITPTAVVGHSLGEYAALNAAGVLTESDTIYLVGKRAQLLQEQCKRGTHSMLAILASLAKIDSILAGKKYEVACINGPEETVLSGPNEEIRAVQEALSEHKLKMTTLKVPYAFHSSQVEPILSTFEKAAAGITFHKPTVPVICPLFGNVVSEAGTFGPKYLSRHCREPVNFLDSLRSAQQSKVLTDKHIAIEIGPHPYMSKMVKATLGPQTSTLHMMQRNKDTWTILTQALSTLYVAGTEIRWSEYHRDFKSAHKVLRLPAYSWDLKDYWIQYVNDWSVRKGDPIPTAQAALPEPVVPKLESTTIHRLVEENKEGFTVKLVVESDISRADLSPLVQGHVVDGIPLCTPSVYADIALTLGKYLVDRYQPDMKERLVDVSDMTIEKALIAKGTGPQLLRTSVEVDWLNKSANVRFYSVNEKGERPATHSKCVIRWVDNSQHHVLERKGAEIKARFDSLRQGVSSGKTSRFNRAMAYKMVKTLADFPEDYKAIDEVIMDSGLLEASSRINFSGCKKGGDYNTNPAYIDGLTQSGGFVMNANDGADLDNEVFINHGWKSFQIFQDISADKIYNTHVRMHPGESNTYVGDVVVMEGDNIAASFRGIVLQGVPRRVLSFILNMEAGRRPQRQAVGQAGAKPAAKAPAAKAPAPVSAPVAKAPVASVPVAAPVTPIAAPIAVPTSQPSEPSKVGPALQIISEESGVAVEDLTDESVFADMGVDSLLSLTIGSRFREELDLDLEVESMFTQFPTVKDLKDHLAPAGNAAPASAPVSVAAVAPVVTAPPVQPSPVSVPVAAPVAASPIQDSKALEKYETALQVISEESGVAVADLTDDSVFTDMGIDSLLTLVITGRFREELDLDVQVEALFTEYPTVKDLKDFLVPSGETKPVETAPAASLTPVATPAPISAPVAPFAPVAPVAPIAAATPVFKPAPVPTIAVSVDSKAQENYQAAIEIISEESGVAVDDLTDDSVFADMGIDSLLTLVITSRFREELDLDIQVEALFTEYPTVKDLKDWLTGGASLNDAAADDSDSTSSSGQSNNNDRTATPLSDVSYSGDYIAKGLKPPVQSTTSVVLQGLPKNTLKTLFLFPDGCGSAHSYAALPRVSTDICVIGLNSPYMKNPKEMSQYNVHEIIESYLTEIRRRQPSGPYHLGGWSAGGIYAFRAASQLINQGEEVQSLVLIDSPVPKGLDRLPQHFYDHCSKIGLFGQAVGASPANPPEWLIPHFNATIDVLHDYWAEPLPAGTAPKTSIIWACESVMDGINFVKPAPHPDDTEGMKFLTEKRADFSPCGWEDFFPDREITVEKAEGATHFSMMRDSFAPKLSAFIERAMTV
ncbi:polyketide synthase [Xylona heveae TC161]|uniref:Polyketide synthase n=1 Tax=Xylona heveae (strain CBS 132557 / TC161) TaxID=1328760 RepID=A0A165JKL0_XYLHT|nr:polyketide synthase [Xylona heveae TC161]KZF26353.1 polyketide synthase [Xylona heveae TC161]